MGILLSEKNRVLVQGITGRQGLFHTELMLDYGTPIVAGVTPGMGETVWLGVKVYDTVIEALRKEVFDTSVIFVPAPFAKEAAFEAMDSDIKILIIVTEGIPLRDSIEIMEKAETKNTIVLGPNCPGIITPNKSKIGVMPAQVFKPGSIGVVSRSGTLTYEVAWKLTECGLGQTTCLGIGGDPVIGLNFIDILKLFENDDQTKAVVLVGEIGGNAEELAAQYIEEEGYSKPLVVYIAGRTAPVGKRMGHAGAIIMGTQGTAISKINAFNSVGVSIAEKPSDVARILLKRM